MQVCHHQLSPEHYFAVSALAERCRQVDGSAIPLYNNQLLQDRPLPCNILHYHQGQLVGFLSLFFFYKEGCELTVMVDPAFRRQGIATALIKEALPLLHTRKLKRVFFPGPKGVNDLWLAAKGYRLHHNEIQMEWQKGRLDCSIDAGLTLRISHDDADIRSLVLIDNTCFNTNKSDMELRFQNLLIDESYRLFIIEYNQHIIGKAHLHQEIDQIQLSDVGILPRYRGHGFGRALVVHIINYAQTHYTLPLRLGVYASNTTAFKLYQKLGFTLINSCDFWVMSFGSFLRCIRPSN